MLQAAVQAGKSVTTDPVASEWIKALIGGFIGAVLGIAASPFTLWVKSLFDRNAAANALYSDLGRMYHVLNRAVDIYPYADAPKAETAQSNQQRAIDLLANDINDETYQYYSTGGAPVFWSIPEAVAIRRLYKLIMVTTSGLSVDHWAATVASIEAVYRQFNIFFDEGRIDETKLLKYRGDHRNKTAEAVTRRNTAGKSTLIRDSQGSPKSRWNSVQ